MALNMDIATESKFDRKKLFLPQIIRKHIKFSQFDPTNWVENGYIDIEVGGKTKRIGITRLHMEEDAGKSTHKDGYSLVDLNRQGYTINRDCV
ncbi:aspartyl/glutamyl-tRNA(Asn/Gln) amidotransferase subunit B [Staphylococcus gallinarum]|uniref:Aspartyl/glutamyl-tRNA(Asn/Gln) amidotransferase subunit B n=1 Tax=Staphylococcus gallinarum TaxID=1293 RepID=A0A380FKY1_STAGA|nr:aspartyl/glutamyl-tRNA(Asn/Gln) amidotransferase subunit B [Staphylococcus gallinarum]